jgi:UDP-glucose 4-epimerase
MKILVTGGCGFIGSHIVDDYITDEHTVVVIDDLSTGSLQNLNERATFYKKDICSPDIENIFEKEQFDVVNHHAAQINVRKSVIDPLLDARINIMGSLNLLMLSIHYGIKRFIFASSGGAVYGEPDQYPIIETTAVSPASPYGIAKATIEQYVQTLSGLHGLDYVILRYSNVYGPRQISTSEAGVISIFINQALNNKKCIVFGDGTSTRDYVFIDDVVRANRTALTCSSKVFNIGTGIETSVNRLIELLSGIVGTEIEHEHDPPRAGEVQRNALDASLAAKHLHWTAQTQLAQGMKKTFDYFSRVHATP